MFLSSFCPKPLIGVLVAFLLLWVPCTFSFISLFIAFIFSSICDHTQPILWASWLSAFWTVHLIGWLTFHRLVAFFLELWSVFIWAIFFVSVCLLHSKGQRFRYSPRRGNPCCCLVVLFVGEGSKKGQCHLLSSPPAFSHSPPLPTSQVGHSGADSQVGGFVYILGFCGSLQWTLLWSWEFLLLPQSSQVFSFRGFEALFPSTGTLGCEVCLTPQLFFPVYLHTNVGCPVL